MRGLLVNFILVQFKEGLKIQSPHQNNKPPTPSPPPPTLPKKRGDYINVYIFINHLGDSRPQNKENLLVWVFLVQWVLQVGKGKEVDNSIEFNSILFTLYTCYNEIQYILTLSRPREMANFSKSLTLNWETTCDIPFKRYFLECAINHTNRDGGSHI